MSDQVDYGEYEAGQYANMETGGSPLDSTRFNQNFLQTSGCGTDGCENQQNPGEMPWMELMSAIPQAGQTANIKAKPSDMATPGDQEVSGIVAQLRGDDGDQYAIGVIKEGWQDFSDGFEPLESALTSALEALNLEWTGDDADAFTDQVQTVIGNIADIKEKIGSADGQGGGSGIIALLEQKQSAIYELQGGGSGEVPYPAPLIWVDNRGMWKTAEVHIRPAFWSGDCEKHSDAFANESGTKILEMAGFDPGYQDEVHNFTDTRASYYYDYYNNEANGYKPGSFSMEEARRMAQQDADSQVNEDVGDIDDNYQQRLDNITNDVIGRRDLADGEVSGFQPSPPQSEQTTLGDGGQPDMGYDPPGAGGGGGMPSAGGGLGDLNPPGGGAGIGGADFNPPPGGIGGGGPGGGIGGGGIGDPGNFDPDNPWSPSDLDPDDLGGGLASGGGGGLGGGLGGPGGGLGGPGGGLGGGAGGGLGGGAGAGVGGMGGMVGGAGAGAGRGAGAGAGGRGGMKGGGMGAGGKGGGGRGMAGGMMGGAGGARGMGGSDDQDGKDTWLVEEDDVWGIGNADEDPYA